ncbi:hypothetical protein RV03_GL002276 [Enterococcus gallinarum]|nr:hypothetical protein RV03_GL002276 [Enterococcus gallinarum]
MVKNFGERSSLPFSSFTNFFLSLFVLLKLSDNLSQKKFLLSFVFCGS